ncbi:MAG: GAF domain-containing protein [Anaerolineales bacterium]|nr:GAF domain-containing protein [Anaerolineales bacterium]
MAHKVLDQLLRRISVRRRIVGGFMLIMLIAGSISPIILSNFNSLTARLEQFTRVDAKIERLLLITSRRVTTSQLNLSRYIQDYVPSPFEALDDVDQAIQGLIEAQTLATDPNQLKTIALIIQSLNDYKQQIIELQKANTAGNNDETTRLTSKIQKLGNDIGISLELLVNNNVKQVTATNEEVLNDAKRSIVLGFLFIAVGFILAITLSFLTSVSITGPLAELRAGAEIFQKGDMVSKINVTGADEFTVIAQILNNLTKQISELISNLETRVAERTNDLEISNQRNEHRAKQYEAISQVARATTSIQNLEILLRDITKLISDQFGFYHAGVFLMDDSREFAVLMAANSKGGKKMLARNHKLKVGQVGIVGYVTGSGNARIALDTGADAVHFDNPDLPDTRSELALPLRIGGQIIGALDVQSIEANAFSQEDVQILSTLADQIAIAIQNARSFEKSRKLLDEAQSTVGSYMTESWQALRPIQKGLGYRFSGNTIKVLESPIEGAHIKDALKKGVAVISGENSDNLAIPVRLRGQVIGVMNLQNPAGQAWDQDQIDIAAATAERLSLAIENATLLQTTQRRADIERITSDISARISSSTRFETILQTAAEELSRALNGSDVLVQIEPVSVKMDSSN